MVGKGCLQGARRFYENFSQVRPGEDPKTCEVGKDEATKRINKTLPVCHKISFT